MIKCQLAAQKCVVQFCLAAALMWCNHTSSSSRKLQLKVQRRLSLVGADITSNYDQFYSLVYLPRESLPG